MAQPASRMGGLAPGQVALYDDTGTRVALTADGKLALLAAAEVTLTVAGTVLKVTPGGVTITGKLVVEGDIEATGTVSDGAGNLR
jgi:phage gp45-like